jgi:hypothetical protein
MNPCTKVELGENIRRACAYTYTSFSAPLIIFVSLFYCFCGVILGVLLYITSLLSSNAYVFLGQVWSRMRA